MSKPEEMTGIEKFLIIVLGAVLLLTAAWSFMVLAG